MSETNREHLFRALRRAEGAADEAWELMRAVFDIRQCSCCGHFGGAAFNAYEDIREASIKLGSAMERVRYALKKEEEEQQTVCSICRETAIRKDLAICHCGRYAHCRCIDQCRHID